MPTSQSKPVLLDNTVLSNFALVNRTDIVMNLWPHCSTTVDAWREFQSGIALGYLPKESWGGLPQIELNESDQGIAQQFLDTLGAAPSYKSSWILGFAGR